jgi:hypothetical protein
MNTACAIIAQRARRRKQAAELRRVAAHQLHVDAREDAPPPFQRPDYTTNRHVPAPPPAGHFASLRALLLKQQKAEPDAGAEVEDY